jgi:hypothetical protein
MSSRFRSCPPLRALALTAVLAAAGVAAACADAPLAPAAPGAAPGATISAEGFGLEPVFAVLPAGTFAGFNFLSPDSLATPVAPIPWDTSAWSVVRHQRDPGSWYAIEPMMAWHGSMCERPDHPDAAKRTHPVSAYRDMVFLCRNHMMTATNASGYGVTYLTPPRLVDFSAGAAVVRFDVATLRETGRDWIDLWLTPYAENLVAPLDDTLPDLQGEPRRGLHVRMSATRGASTFEASVIRGFDAVRLPAADTRSYEAVFASRGLAPSATRRDTFELHVSRTRVRFGMPRYGLWWVDAEIPGGLDWDRAVTQFGHHSFNPAGDGGGPTTWHWDNIGASPSVPFTILRAGRRYVDGTTPGEVAFAAAAPSGAFLRASRIGATEVSFAEADGQFGRWEEVRRQFQERDDPARFASIWMPVPPGATRVRFRPARTKDAPADPWMVRDIEIWAGQPGLGAPNAAGAARRGG